MFENFIKILKNGNEDNKYLYLLGTVRNGLLGIVAASLFFGSYVNAQELKNSTGTLYFPSKVAKEVVNKKMNKMEKNYLKNNNNNNNKINSKIEEEKLKIYKEIKDTIINKFKEKKLNYEGPLDPVINYDVKNLFSVLPKAAKNEIKKGLN